MGINTDTDVYQAMVNNTRVFGATKVNEAKFSVSYLSNGHVSPRANTENVVKDLGIGIPSDNPLYWGVPNVGITGIEGLGEARCSIPQLRYKPYKRWTISPGPKGNTLSNLAGNFEGSVTTNSAVLLPAAASISTNGTHRALISPRGRA
jgi:hypothetical protein